jgi:hypothetical protein
MHLLGRRERLLRLFLVMGLCVLGGACGLYQRAVESTRKNLTARYTAEFACATPDALESPDGFRIEGCGQVAFYHCDWSRDAHSTGSHGRVCSTGQAGCPSSVADRYARAIEPDCVLEHVRPMTAEEQLAAARRQQPKIDEAAEKQRAADRQRVLEAERAAGFAAARKSLTARPDSLQPLCQVEADGLHIELARLADHASFVLLRFTTPRELSPAPCRPTIVLDHQILRTETIDHHSAHEAAFLILAAELQGLDHSQHFRGVVCGVDFDLDEPARRKLAGTAARP